MNEMSTAPADPTLVQLAAQMLTAPTTSRDVLSREVADLQGTANSGGPWTAEEDALLYERMLHPLTLSTLLGRTMAAIQVRKSLLGISASDEHTNKHRRWTPAEDIVIRRADLTISEMATMLRRDYWGIVGRRRQLGITFRSLGNTVSRAVPHPSGFPAPVAKLLAIA